MNIVLANELALDIFNKDPEIVFYLKRPNRGFWDSRDKLIEFPRWIRNTYDLWKRKDLDAHPDDFSAEVVKILLTYD